MLASERVARSLASMGSDRIWEVVAVDEFRLEEQTQPEVKGRLGCVSQPMRFFAERLTPDHLQCWEAPKGQCRVDRAASQSSLVLA